MRSFVEEPRTEDIRVEGVLEALSDPVRLSIVQRLERDGSLPCGTWVGPIAKSTVSHHLAVLRSAGIVAQTQEGTLRINHLRRDDLDARFPGLLDSVLGALVRQSTEAAKG